MFEFFSEMMQDKQWINPGMDNYYLLETLMKSGHFNPENFDDISFALETIWLKSHHLKSRFRQIMKQRQTTIVEALEGWTEEQKKTKTEQVELPVTDPSKSQEQKNENEQLATPVANDSTKQNNDKQNGEKTNGLPHADLEDTALEPVFSLGNTGITTAGAMALHAKEEKEKLIVNRPYVFTNDYFPIKSRHLQQAWRTLKNKQDAGFNATISISQTITRTARKGYFTDFVFEKNTVNQLRLFVFIDQSESMVAVEEFGKEICSAAVSSNMYPGLVPLYFNKVPAINGNNGDYLLTNEDGTFHNTLGKLFAPYFKKNIVVLLYSDAGALKNEMDEKRIQETRKFIHHLYQKTGYLAWLNPAPKNRWQGTNAGILQEDITMFETNNSKTGRSEFENAMAALKGKWMC